MKKEITPEQFEALHSSVIKILLFLSVSGLPENAAKMISNDLQDALPWLESKFDEVCNEN